MEAKEKELRHQTMFIANNTFFAVMEQELAEHGSVRIRVKGISMEPMLRNNKDEVQIIPYDGKELTPKDICLFRYQGKHVLHRFVRRVEGVYYFQGDNVLVRCEKCEQKDIVGVVQTIYRDGQSLPPFSEEWQHRIKRHRSKQRLRIAVTSRIPKGMKRLIKKMLGMKNSQ